MYPIVCSGFYNGSWTFENWETSNRRGKTEKFTLLLYNVVSGIHGAKKEKQKEYRKKGIFMKLCKTNQIYYSSKNEGKEN